MLPSATWQEAFHGLGMELEDSPLGAPGGWGASRMGWDGKKTLYNWRYRVHDGGVVWLQPANLRTALVVGYVWAMFVGYGWLRWFTTGSTGVYDGDFLNM